MLFGGVELNGLWEEEEFVGLEGPWGGFHSGVFFFPLSDAKYLETDLAKAQSSPV